MTNLNSYKIDNHLYKLEDEYQFGSDTMKIVTITNVNDNVFFFCEKQNGPVVIRIDASSSVSTVIVPIHAIVFHKRVLQTLNNTNS